MQLLLFRLDWVVQGRVVLWDKVTSACNARIILEHGVIEEGWGASHSRLSSHFELESEKVEKTPSLISIEYYKKYFTQYNFLFMYSQKRLKQASLPNTN
jgi:hypothetical protein